MDTLNKLPTDLIQQIVPYIPYKYIVEYDTYDYDNPVVLYFKDFIECVSKQIVGGYDIDKIKIKLKKFIDIYILNVHWISPRYEIIYGVPTNDEERDHLYDPYEDTEFLVDILEFFAGYEDEWLDDFISDDNPWLDEFEIEDLPSPDDFDSFYDLNHYQRIAMLKFMLFSSCCIKNN